MMISMNSTSNVCTVIRYNAGRNTGETRFHKGMIVDDKWAEHGLWSLPVKSLNSVLRNKEFLVKSSKIMALPSGKLCFKLHKCWLGFGSEMMHSCVFCSLVQSISKVCYCLCDWLQFGLSIMSPLLVLNCVFWISTMHYQSCSIYMSEYINSQTLLTAMQHHSRNSTTHKFCH